jgi:hypothetical protein
MVIASAVRKISVAGLGLSCRSKIKRKKDKEKADEADNRFPARPFTATKTKVEKPKLKDTRLRRGHKGERQISNLKSREKERGRRHVLAKARLRARTLRVPSLDLLAWSGTNARTDRFRGPLARGEASGLFSCEKADASPFRQRNSGGKAWRAMQFQELNYRKRRNEALKLQQAYISIGKYIQNFHRHTLGFHRDTLA